MSSNAIELNGKRYDVRTGRILPAQEAVKGGRASFVRPVAKQSGAALDGFTRRKAAASPAKTTAYAVHKKTEKSKTLMRHAVKKPAQTKSKSAPQITRQAPRMDVGYTNPKRASHAKVVKKSSLISRFGVPARAVKPIAAVLPVRPEPAAPPLPVFTEHHKPTIAQRHQKSLKAAIDRSTAHTQPKARKSTRRHRLSQKLRVSNRTVNIAAASLAAVLLVGFIAYQNVPNLSMRLAAARAGVEGSLPGYQPSGFGLNGPIKYQPGQITLSYASHSDDRQFQVSQKASQWNSETLLENYVGTGQKTYQTFQDAGKTIYIYDDNNATWVDGGVWYQIEGNSALNSDQLLRMAASM
ncbi:MAG TPA: DUF4367 domain-containing protein [Candidatus Limnocylindria bacterium]|nr:DUF4367 domain-containing protein [Candidatus Limnocylindria bacterium]